MPFTVAGAFPTYTLGLCREKARVIQFRCANCDRPPVLLIRAAMDAFADGATLAEIADRATYSACGSRDGELPIRQGGSPTPDKAQAVRGGAEPSD